MIAREIGVEPQDGQGLGARNNPVVNRERGESQEGRKGKDWGAKGGKARLLPQSGSEKPMSRQLCRQ